MIEQSSQDIWTYQANCVVITTNGFVRRDGACVMGRGIALQAKRRYPSVEYRIGEAIRSQGNHVYMMGDLCTFPVKHNWWEKADLDLIRRSAQELAELARQYPDMVFAMPHPGCHNGGRDWSEVKPLLESVLPDNIHIVDYKL